MFASSGLISCGWQCDNDSDISVQVKQAAGPGFPWNWVSREWLMWWRGDTMLQQHFEFSSQNIPLHSHLIESVIMFPCTQQGTNAPQWDQCASPQYSREYCGICTYRFPMTALNLVGLSWFTLHSDKTLKWSDTNTIMKYNNKKSLYHIAPLAVCCTPPLYSPYLLKYD